MKTLLILWITLPAGTYVSPIFEYPTAEECSAKQERIVAGYKDTRYPLLTLCAEVRE